ncbi:uncharacterized protein V1518DRAFT_17137 [Limtongia smithiae]|uniref:uncharacterized protein n=1 Tax=Limtongia smithiae TaxID=1125753 RepID=UPI0034D002C7
MDIFTYKETHAPLLSPFGVGSLDIDSGIPYREDCIAPETDSHGAVEYKLHMLSPHPARLAQLTTQLQWRLTQGQGQAIYEIGVGDNGTLFGLSEREIYASLATLKKMSNAVGAWFKVVRVITVNGQGAVTTVPDSHIDNQGLRRVVEVHVFKKAVEKDVVRLFLVGSSNSGKSSLLGKICYDTHDNGRGKSRVKVMKHRHELVSGETTSIGIDVFGYNPRSRESPVGSVGSFGSSREGSTDDDYDFYDEEEARRAVVTNYTNKYTCEEIVRSSRRIVMAFDSPGATAKFGSLCRNIALYSPDVTFVTVSAHSGGRWMEYLDLALRTTPRVAVLLTKSDTVRNSEHLKTLLRMILMRISTFRREDTGSGDGVERTLFGKMVNSASIAEDCAANECCVPVFLVSAVSGTGVAFLHDFLNAAEIGPRATGARTIEDDDDEKLDEDMDSEILDLDTTDVEYDHILRHTSSCTCRSTGGPASTERDGGLNFFVTSVYDSGRILTGVVRSGTVTVGHTYAMGNAGAASMLVVVRSVQKLRIPCLHLRQGDIGSIGIELVSSCSDEMDRACARLQKGMSVVNQSNEGSDAADTAMQIEVEFSSAFAATANTLPVAVPVTVGAPVTVHSGFSRGGTVTAVADGHAWIQLHGTRPEIVAKGQCVIVITAAVTTPTADGEDTVASACSVGVVVGTTP